MRKSYLFSVLIFVLLGCAVYSQSNELMDELLRQEQALFGQTCYLILAAGGVVAETTSVVDCIATIQNKGWGFRRKQVEDPVTIGELSYLIMRALEVNGGIMYALFPSPRYAFRELTFRGIVEEAAGPFRIVSGDEVVSTLGSVMEWKEMYQ